MSPCDGESGRRDGWVRRRALALGAVLWAPVALAQTPPCPSGPPCQGGPLPGPLPLFPATNWWNLDISSAPVDANSGNFITFINLLRSVNLRPDFGGVDNSTPDGIFGFPYVVVSGSQPKLTVNFSDFPGESDGVGVNFYPIPSEAITTPHWIEGGQPGNQDQRASNDRHLLVVDQDNKLLYELYNVFYNGTQWAPGRGAFFAMKTNNRRPQPSTSPHPPALAILPAPVAYA